MVSIGQLVHVGVDVQSLIKDRETVMERVRHRSIQPTLVSPEAKAELSTGKRWLALLRIARRYHDGRLLTGKSRL